MPGKNFSDFLKHGKDVSSKEENIDVFSNEEKEDYVAKEKYFNEFGFSSDEQMPSSPNFGNFMKPTSAETLEELNSSGTALANKTKSGNPSSDVDFMSQMQKMYTSLSQGEEEENIQESLVQNAPGAEQDPSSESQPFQSAPTATCDSEEPSQEKEGASIGRVSVEADMKEESIDYTYIDFEEEGDTLPDSVYEELEIPERIENKTFEIQEETVEEKETLSYDKLFEKTQDEPVYEELKDSEAEKEESSIDKLFEKTQNEPRYEEFEDSVEEEIEVFNEKLSEETVETQSIKEVEPENEEDYWNYIDGLLTHFDDGKIHSKINSPSYDSIKSGQKTTGFFMKPQKNEEEEEALIFNLPKEEDHNEKEEPIFMDYDVEDEYEGLEKDRPVVWKVIVAILAAIVVITVIFFLTSSNAITAVCNDVPSLTESSSAVIGLNFNPVF